MQANENMKAEKKNLTAVKRVRICFTFIKQNTVL